MKVEASRGNVEPAFEPVTITITCESERELSAFYIVHNHADVTRFWYEMGVNSELIKGAITEAFGRRPTYTPYWSAFCDAIKGNIIKW